MSIYTRVVHTHESKDYILRPLSDSESSVPPNLTWWGRGVAAFNDPRIVEGGPADPDAVAGLLDDRLHPRWEDFLRGGATLDSCRLGRKPATFAGGVQRAAVAGLSGNVAPSKSVSMLMVAGDEHVANLVTAAHRQAVAAALDFLQDNGDIARAGHDLIGLVGVLDQRYTSKVGNPHLSTTATIVNVAPRHDGKWVATQTREVLRWMIAVKTYTDAHLHRTLSTHPELKLSVTPGDGLPTVTSDAVDAGTCQRYCGDESTREPLPAAPTLASTVSSTHTADTDVTLPALRKRTQLDGTPVALGEPNSLPAWTEEHLHTALSHAAGWLTTQHGKRATLGTHHLVSSALVGLLLAGPVDSPLDSDITTLMHMLSDRPDVRHRVWHSHRFDQKDRDGVAPTLR